MLEESDFDSWKIRIRRYIHGKPNGKLIWNSIKKGPTPHPTTTDTTGEGEQQTHYSPSQYGPLQTHYTPPPQQSPQSTNDAMLATMNQIVNLLSGFQKQFPPTNNQLRTSTNPMTQATIQAGQITTESVQRRALGNKERECKEKKREKDSQWFKDKALLMEAKEKGVVLDAEAEAFLADVECIAYYDDSLAITTTTEFKVSHEDAYDSDVDEAPHAAAAFMANLTGTSTREGTSNDTGFHSEVHTHNNHFFKNVNHPVTQVMHQEEQLDSDVDSDIDDYDNIIPYHQYQSDTEVENVPTEVSPVLSDQISMITVLDDMRLKLEGYMNTSKEQSLANDSLKAELKRYKTQVQNLEQCKVKRDLKQLVTKRNKQNADLEEQIVSLKQQLSQQIIPFYEKLKTHVKGIEDNLFKEVSEYMKNFDELDKEYDQCVIDKKCLEIENKNLQIQNECLLTESVSKDICSVVLTPINVVPISVEPCFNCDKEQTRNLELEAEISKVKQLLVDKERRCSHIEMEYLNLEVKFQNTNNVLKIYRIKNDSLRDENVSIKARFQELYKSKAGCNSCVSSGATIHVKPKAVASGLYAMTPKNVPPQKRINRETNSSLPRKETVIVIDLSNVPVNLPTRIKYVPDASKSKSKSDKKIHKNFLARSKNVKRFSNPHRNLNKKNRVDSSLNDKHTGFLSKSISVCKTCNECLVFGNHDDCVVKSVNAKKPKVINNANVKQVWKATGKVFASVGSQWKPTGRKFTLGDTCPLTRITKPEVVSLENSRSVRTGEPTNNVTVTPRFSEKTLTSYKRKDRNTKDTSTGSPSNIEIMAAKYHVIVYPLPL
uniref:Integrase, catalytic region, zinc finger, CCHC-type, peptidase aspartic, catalytic n=1 Tax=Tanacetum cinerariifolium TaxID=118510 RepID=A0A6L2JVE7_TANCI|nr:hypothetical protein [Tanacetum cinerariifolium]